MNVETRLTTFFYKPLQIFQVNANRFRLPLAEMDSFFFDQI